MAGILIDRIVRGVAVAETYPTASVIPFSAKTGAGRGEVWKKIRQSAAEFPASAFQS
jgi:predicted nuclease with RNAse H fold